MISLLASCGGDGSSGGVPAASKPVLASNARVAEPADAQLATVLADRLVFPNNNTFAQGLKSGDIVVSGYEGGFLRSVQTVETKGTDLIVHTGDASLQDVVVTGTLGNTESVSASQQFLHAQDTHDGTSNMSFTTALDGMQLGKADGLLATVKSGTVSVKGAVDVGFTYDHGVQEGHVVAGGQIDVDMEVEVDVSGDKAVDQTVELWHSIDVPLNLAAFVSCHSQFVVRGHLNVTASGRATLRVKQTLHLDSKYGFRFTRAGGFEKVGEFTPTWDQGEPTFGSSVDVEGRVDLQAGIEVVFYPGTKILGKLTGTQAKTTILAGPYARLKYASSDPAPGWGLWGGVAVTATADASIMGAGFGPWKWTPYENEQMLLPKADETAPIDGGDCADGKADGIESDADCGATCADCASGASCVDDSDCQTAACVGGVCSPATCQNGAMDAGETGVDCGGSCPLCAGDACQESSQCGQGNCTEGKCEAPLTCFDDVMNAGEEDVDCGGACSPCPQGQVGLCDDGQTDNGEEDVDCGGPCAPCNGGTGGAGGAGGGGGGAGGAGGASSCDSAADCGACATCADAAMCSQEYSDCFASPDCVCLYDCAGDSTCADQKCGSDTSAGLPSFDAIWSCENCACPIKCGSPCP